MTDSTYHVTPADAVELFAFSPESGRVFFYKRARRWFESDQSCATWNARFAGKETFTYLDKQKGEYTGKILGHTVRRSVLVWCLSRGDWPRLRLGFKDGNKTNTRPDNLEYRISRRVRAEMNRRTK